jgi:hypothetical protein
MQYWNSIIKTAMLGTAREFEKIHSGTEELDHIIDKINQLQTDKEDKFLKTASVVSHFRKAGKLFPSSAIQLPEAAIPEIKPYCSDQAVTILDNLQQSAYTDLIVAWMERCIRANQIVSPQLLPFLLELGKTNLPMRKSITDAGGNRVKWLAAFNPEWAYATKTDEEIWLTGKPDERRNFLSYLRIHKPQEAIETLSESWKEETPAFRLDALNIIAKSLSITDEEFLKSLSKDNSPKVRQKAIELLRLIPDSSYNKELFSKIETWLEVETDRSSGLQKPEIRTNIPIDYDQELKKEGISEETMHKAYSNQEHRLFQVLMIIPLQLWERKFSLNSGQLFNLFVKQESLHKFIPSVVYAAVNQKNQQWASAIAAYITEHEGKITFIRSEEELNQLISLLSDEEKKWVYEKELYNRHFTFPVHIIDFLHAIGFKWSPEFSQKILENMVNKHLQELLNHYYFHDKIYRLHNYFAPSVLSLRYGILPQDEVQKNRWYKLTDKIFEAINISRQIDEAFKVS